MEWNLAQRTMGTLLPALRRRRRVWTIAARPSLLRLFRRGGWPTHHKHPAHCGGEEEQNGGSEAEYDADAQRRGVGNVIVAV